MKITRVGLGDFSTRVADRNDEQDGLICLPLLCRIAIYQKGIRFCTSDYIIVEYGIIAICTRFERANEGSGTCGGWRGV